MPLALEPSERFEIVLESDKDKPRETQPRFYYRYLTGRQWRAVARRQDELEGLGSGEAVADATYESAKTGLVGWENMTTPVDTRYVAAGGDFPFDPDNLEDVIGLVEAQELIAKLLRQIPDAADKKKLESPSVSDSEQSVKTVEVPIDVETAPAH